MKYESSRLPGLGLAGREVKLETISTVLRKQGPSAGEQKGNFIPITRQQRLLTRRHQASNAHTTPSMCDGWLH